MIAHAVPELAVAPRSSSITRDRGEKNVNVNGTTQRRGGRGQTEAGGVPTGRTRRGTLIWTGCAPWVPRQFRCARVSPHLNETLTLEVVLDEADEPIRAAESS